MKSSGETGMGGMMGVGAAAAAAAKKDAEVAVGQAPVAAGFLPEKVGDGVVVGGLMLPSDSQIVWSGNDPNADIPFDEAFQNKPQKTSAWTESYTEARRESLRSGKPILMWFTKTASPGSPNCRTLNSSLFTTDEFISWAKENVVRLKIDVSGGSEQRGEGISKDTFQKRKYAEQLVKQYRVLGYPALFVLEPDGGIYLRERGYRRERKTEVFDKLKNAALTINYRRGAWESKMTKKGYRKWTGKNDQVVFAKLTRYHDGNVWLTEPDGNAIKTTMRWLSNDDRGYILDEQEKRKGN